MNEKKFLKELNNKDNKDGKFTLATIYELFREETKALTKQNTNIFQRLFRNRKKVKSANQIIYDNFDLILEKLGEQHVITTLIAIAERDELNQICIRDNFEKVLNRINNQNDEFDNIPDFLHRYLENEENNKFVYENIDLICAKTKPLEAFETVSILNKKFPSEHEKLNLLLEKNKYKVVESMLDNSLWKNNPDSSKQYIQTVLIMFEELLKDESKRWVDIEKIGGGAYSQVYSVGDKVLKLGPKRETYNIPNNKRILQPLIRTNLLDDENNSIACVEISEKVKVGDANDEELYQLYKNLRKDNIICTDFKRANVGRLIKDNYAYLNGNKNYVAPNSVGFDEKLKDEALLKGELVILDTDFIFYANNPNIKWPEEEYAKQLEKRYQNEVAKEIGRKFSENSLENKKNIQAIEASR